MFNDSFYILHIPSNFAFILHVNINSILAINFLDSKSLKYMYALMFSLLGLEISKFRVEQEKVFLTVFQITIKCQITDSRFLLNFLYTILLTLLYFNNYFHIS